MSLGLLVFATCVMAAGTNQYKLDAFSSLGKMSPYQPLPHAGKMKKQ